LLVIDFRYHLVSIIAVFLALAIGIVVGSTALQGGTEDTLRHLVNTVSQHNNTLRQQNNLLRGQVSADQTFVQAADRRLLDGLLAGQRVVLVTAPGADGATVAGITAAVKRAGATVTGQVSLSPAFFDTSAGTESSLDTLARQLAPAGVSLGGQAGNQQIAGQQAAARVIASALVARDGTTQDASPLDSNAILSGFGQRNYLQVSANSSTGSLQPATLAVVVIPATPPVNDTSPANLGLIAVAQALQTASNGTVLAGSLSGSGSNSAIDAISSGAVTGSLSTVDCADTQVCQVAVAQALWELLTGHKPAAYGVRPDAFPSPAPSPSSVGTSSTTSPSTSSSGHQTRKTSGSRK
jgi:Copper transport outer membrane protein, MctB